MLDYGEIGPKGVTSSGALSFLRTGRRDLHHIVSGCVLFVERCGSFCFAATDYQISLPSQVTRDSLNAGYKSLLSSLRTSTMA